MRQVSLALVLAALLLGLLTAGCTAPCTIPGDCPLQPVSQCLDQPSPAAPPPSALALRGVRTVLDPEAPARPIALAECIALAMENGRLTRDGTNESIRVFAYEPAVAGSDVEASLARFDVRWQSSMTWNVTDRPSGISSLNSAASIQQQSAQGAMLESGLQKPLPTGGVAGITLRNEYQYSNRPGAPDTFNPIYAPTLRFNFDQPLLLGYGVEINQLRTSHPTAQTGRGSGQGILLARVTFDQSRTDFERRVQDIVLGVEEAYWNLYCSYWILYSREIALRQVYREWLEGTRKAAVGRITTQDLNQIEVQYQQFRAERLAALGNGLGQPGVLEAERLLRLAIGLPPEDGCRLVPSDTPTVAPYQPDWAVAVQQAVTLRPELVRARQEVKAAQLNLIREQNELLPDLRFVSSYDANGIGSRLDGPTEGNAFRSLASNHFNNWSVGLTLDVPIGFREANAIVRRTRLQLAQRFASLRNQEEQIVFELQRTYRQLFQSIEQVRIQRARRAAASRQLVARYEEFRTGVKEFVLLNLLTAQQSLADALRDEMLAICEYNIALAQFERQKGTILVHDGVEIAEGPVPVCVQQRASENIRRRQAALVLRERSAPADDEAPLLHAPAGEPVPLPQLLDGPKLPDELPQPAASELLTPPPPVPGAKNSPK